MSWLYVPGTADSSKVSSLPDYPSELLLMWRSKPMQPRTWSRLWKAGGWIRLLSGLTCEHSQLEAGVELFRASVPGFRVSLGPLRALERESTTSDGSGKTSTASFARFDPSSCSWRTSLGWLPGLEPNQDSDTFSGHWPRSGLMLRGQLYERQTQVPHISERASSFSGSTPTMEEPFSGDAWPTPDAGARNGTNGGDWSVGSYHRAKAGAGIVERPTLMKLAAIWPTPTARDWKDTGENTNYQRQADKGLLAGTAAVWPNPGTSRADAMRSHQDQQTEKAGSDGSKRATLNPRFVEALMGLEIMGGHIRL